MKKLKKDLSVKVRLLAELSEEEKKLWQRVEDLIKREEDGGYLDESVYICIAESQAREKMTDEELELWQKIKKTEEVLSRMIILEEEPVVIKKPWLRSVDIWGHNYNWDEELVIGKKRGFYCHLIKADSEEAAKKGSELFNRYYFYEGCYYLPFRRTESPVKEGINAAVRKFRQGVVNREVVPFSYKGETHYALCLDGEWWHVRRVSKYNGNLNDWDGFYYKDRLNWALKGDVYPNVEAAIAYFISQ